MGVFAYYDADTDGIVFYVPPDAHSENASTLESESESSASATTIHSENVPGYFVLHHGRQHPASENTLKWLPPDNIQRHILKYVINRWMFGGSFVGPVEAALVPVEGRKRRVLELGTRTGTWVQAMAIEFPHVQFLSLDIVPVIAHAQRSNILFEVYDFTEEILLEDESQDGVFLNNMFDLVRDYRALLREVHRVLRPGGFIHTNEFSSQMWDPADLTTPAWRTNPKGCEQFRRVRDHIAKMGVDPDTCDKLPEWLGTASSLWGELAGQRGFAQIQSVVRTRPAYPHSGCACMDGIDSNTAQLLRHFTVTVGKDVLGILKDSGMDEQEAKRSIEDVLEEMKHPDKCVLFKCRCVYAIRR